MTFDTLSGRTIVVTGVTGQVARPLAVTLARDNRVVGAARFKDDEVRRELEASGIECAPVDLLSGDVGALPDDADYVLNFAVAKTNDWDADLSANLGGLATLMEHHRSARAFLHCSSAAVYAPAGHQLLDEASPLGDNHGVWPFLRTYSICKIGAEGTARWAAERFGLPTTIARLSVPYGDNGGWPYYHMEMVLAGIPIPVPAGGPARYNPIHEDDIIATIPKLLEVASVPATTLNWCGEQTVSLQEWCSYLGSLVGKEPVFQESEQALRGNPTDPSRMRELVGVTTVDWQDGMRRLATKFHPELVGSG